MNANSPMATPQEAKPLDSVAIEKLIIAALGEEVVTGRDHEAAQAWLEIAPAQIAAVCRLLWESPAIWMDYLSCLSGVDWGPKEDRMQVVYHLVSIPHGHRLVLKCNLPRSKAATHPEAEKTETAPEIPEVSPGTPETEPEAPKAASEIQETAPETPEKEQKTPQPYKLVNGTWLPALPTVTGIWKTAEWHEREAYDLCGIWFEGHPDMRRILLPEDWTGHPLRKDYSTPDSYHGIQVDY